MAYAFQPPAGEEPALDVAAPFERALTLARGGQVAWLTEHGHRAFAVMPAEVAEQALDALEEIEDLKALDAARAEGGQGRPLAEVFAELDREDAAQP